MAQPLSVFHVTIVLAVLATGTGWSGSGAAQGPQSPDPRIEAERAQRELTAAENVLRDARAARAKTEADTADRLARLDERRRSAQALPDEAGRQTALRAISAEERTVRAGQAKARAAEATAERNAETAALALARARSGAASGATREGAPSGATRRSKSEGGVTPLGVHPRDDSPAAPATAVSLEALIHARMDVESAETAFARARAAREDIARKVGAEVRDLTQQLAETVALRKRAGDGRRAAEAATLEASLKALIQDATGKLSEAEIRETEAVAALEAARARSAGARRNRGAVARALGWVRISYLRHSRATRLREARFGGRRTGGNPSCPWTPAFAGVTV
ncbi:MAG: hypothetical protein EXR02_04330 [Rhodospirillales bacterium]|nr:hypothetical protein [Rhodospirillales bacterium]MSP80281.1 hypothetical protein [Rhodospirillales bacterium]